MNADVAGDGWWNIAWDNHSRPDKPHVIEFIGSGELALAHGVVMTETGRTGVVVFPAEVIEIPEDVKARIREGINARLGLERLQERLAGPLGEAMR